MTVLRSALRKTQVIYAKVTEDQMMCCHHGPIRCQIAQDGADLVDVVRKVVVQLTTIVVARAKSDLTSSGA